MGATLTIHLPDDAATQRLGAQLAACLQCGDTVLLSGPLGAGKSALARAAIRAWAGQPDLDVPSPSYTLVNVYETRRGEVWHADLYRLGEPGELDELGLSDAAETALLLIEWPERMAVRPARCLTVTLAPDGDGRRAVLDGSGPGWDAALSALRPAA